VKGIVEKDVRNEYGAIMERLRSAEGVKLAVLQYDIAEVQKDITRIDEILKAMDELGGGSEIGLDMLGFLLRFRHLHENIDYAITKQFKVEIEIFPNDLPRELAERRVLMEHYEQQRKLLSLKDDIIWKLVQERQSKNDYFQSEFDKATKQEMNEWAKLIDMYAGELKRYQIICSFCGVHLDETIVNQKCSSNAADPGEYFTEEAPGADAIGTHRHHFGKPSANKGLK
jgi:palmitoyltransferase